MAKFNYRPKITEDDLIRSPGFTFVIISDDFALGHKSFEAPIPELDADLKTAAAIACVGHQDIPPIYKRFNVFVYGKQSLNRWVLASKEDEVQKDGQYIIVLTKEECYRYLINGAIYAITDRGHGSYECDWSISLLVTDIFATRPLFDQNRWYIENGIDPNGHSIPKTYLSVIHGSGCLQEDEIVSVTTVSGGYLRRLNEISTGGEGGSMKTMRVSELRPIKIERSRKTIEALLPFYEDLESGAMLFYVVHGTCLDSKSMEWNAIGQAKIAVKQEGTTLNHFICGRDKHAKAVTINVKQGTTMINILPLLSKEFGVPIEQLGSCYIQTCEGEMLVIKYAVDIKEFKDQAAYLFELKQV